MRPTAETATLAQIISLIPILFHRLRAVGDALHEEHGITTPMRGVMQSLFDGGAQTVPQMAAARPVSRQHIQTIVDALAERDLVRALPNPAHKRSSLIDLTEAGYDVFVRMREAELKVIEKALGGFAIGDLETTRDVLTKIASQLETLIHTRKETANEP